MDEEGCELPAERPGVLPAQIDLVIHAVQPEPHRLVRRAPVKVVLQYDGYLCRHPGLLSAMGLPARYRPAAPRARGSATMAGPGGPIPAPRPVRPLAAAARARPGSGSRAARSPGRPARCRPEAATG